MSRVEPLSALGFFVVTRNLEVYQTVVFEYFDSEGEYARIADNEEELERELERLASAMQMYLDTEEVILNGRKVKPAVKAVDIGFKDSPEEVFVTYFIFFKGSPRDGVNYYENLYEDEVAEYPITAYWYFPPGSRVLSAQMSGDVAIIAPDVLVARLDEGEKVFGYERIEFILPARKRK